MGVEAKLKELGLELPSTPPAVGMQALPFGIAVEIEMIFEVA
jgi:hypothetical protein